MARFTAFLLAFPLALWATAAEARVIKVPSAEASTVGAAVTAAYPGDTIKVGAGRWCGAVIDKQLTLIGEDGKSVIVGFTDGATCDVGAVGFMLTPGASGTVIRGFMFDGADVANDASSLAFALLASEPVDDVRFEHNRVLGTIQAVSNFGGSGWVVSHNRFVGLTVMSENGGGGLGVVFVSSGDRKPTGGEISHNHFESAVPAVLPEGASIAAVLLMSVDGTAVEHNRVKFRRGGAAAEGVGVRVMAMAFDPNLAVGVRVRHNDGRDSDYVAVVDDKASVAELRHNAGVTLLEGEVLSSPDGVRVAKAEKADKADRKGKRNPRILKP